MQRGQWTPRRRILAAELTPGVFWQEVAFEWRLGWCFEQQGEREQDGEREHMLHSGSNALLS